MPDNDEFDALLEEPFGDDVDWTEVEGMTVLTPSRQEGPGSDSEAYFGDDDDEAFLAEVRQLEERVTQNGGTPNARICCLHIPLATSLKGVDAHHQVVVLCLGPCSLPIPQPLSLLRRHHDPTMPPGALRMALPDPLRN